MRTEQAAKIRKKTETWSPLIINQDLQMLSVFLRLGCADECKVAICIELLTDSGMNRIFAGRSLYAGLCISIILQINKEESGIPVLDARLRICFVFADFTTLSGGVANTDGKNR